MNKVIKVNFLVSNFIKCIKPELFDILMNEFKKRKINLHCLSDEINPLVNKYCKPILTKLFNKMKNKYIRIKINRESLINYNEAKYTLEPTVLNHIIMEFSLPFNKVRIIINIHNITINSNKKIKLDITSNIINYYAREHFYPIEIYISNKETHKNKKSWMVYSNTGFNVNKQCNYINLPQIANKKHQWQKKYIIHNINKKCKENYLFALKKEISIKHITIKRQKGQIDEWINERSYLNSFETVQKILLLHKILYHSIGYFRNNINTNNINTNNINTNNKQLYESYRGGKFEITTKDNYSYYSYDVLFTTIVQKMITIESNETLNKIVNEYTDYINNKSKKIPIMYTIDTILPLSNTLKYLFQNKYIFLCKDTKKKFIKIIYVIKYLFNNYKINYSECVIKIILNKFGLI